MKKLMKYLFLVAGILVGGHEAMAQVAAPSGIMISGSGYWAPGRLGGGQGVGPGAAIIFGVSPAVSIEGAWARISKITTNDAVDPRRYGVDIASLSLRARVAGRNNGLDLVIGGGALIHRLEASGGSPKETKTIPFVAPGLAIRQRLGGPVYLDILARAPMVWARDGELGATPGESGFGMGGEFRIGFSLLWRRSVPVSREMPIDVPEGYQPVEAASVARVANPGISSVAVAQEPEISERDLWIRRHLTTVFFAEGSAEVGAEYREIFRQIASYLIENPTINIDLIGFTENRQGRNQTKQQILAESRGTAIKAILVRVYGVEEHRLLVSAVGTDFDTPEASLARRVDILAKVPR